MSRETLPHLTIESASTSPNSSCASHAPAGELFSYIRLGADADRRRSPHNFTSSPTLSHPTNHYVWDFLNWGFTAPYGLEQFSEVTPCDTDIVPYGNMDQGRLFVRVSVQDLSTLQLAYQSGLAALQRAQSKVDKLSDENHRLHTMVKNWTIKTTALTTESIELRQEISSIRKKMKTCTVPIEQHKDLILTLCSKICRIFEDSSISPHSSTVSFDELLRIVFSLPPLVQDRLSESCPCFTDFINGSETGLLIKMQMDDAKRTIEKILKVLPPEMEATLLKSVVKEFAQKHGSLTDPPSGLPYTRREQSNAEPHEHRTPLQLPELIQTSHHTQLALSSDREETPPPLPERKYSPSEVVTTPDDQKEVADDENQAMREPVMSSSYHNAIDHQRETACSEVRSRCQTHPGENLERSGSSSIGIPLAHSTPCGTISRLVSPRLQVNHQPSKRKKKKISRWNLAARICSTGRTPTLSDSESFDKTYTCTNTHLQNKRANQ